MVKEVIMAVVATIFSLLALNNSYNTSEESPAEPIYFQGRFKVNKDGAMKLTLKDLDKFCEDKESKPKDQ